jgi:hypothetical protein
MAQSPSTTLPPVTEEAFVADRQAFLHSFTKFTFGMVVFLVILLTLMAIFLV